MELNFVSGGPTSFRQRSNDELISTSSHAVIGKSGSFVRKPIHNLHFHYGQYGNYGSVLNTIRHKCFPFLELFLIGKHSVLGFYTESSLRGTSKQQIQTNFIMIDVLNATIYSVRFYFSYDKVRVDTKLQWHACQCFNELAQAFKNISLRHPGL